MADGLTHPTPAHQDAPFRRQGRSERRGESYSVPYVEPLSDARTTLVDFFSILLDIRRSIDIPADQRVGLDRLSFLVVIEGFSKFSKRAFRNGRPHPAHEM